MAKYKKIDLKQSLLAAIRNHPRNICLCLNYIVDNQLDLSIFDKRYKNDETGAIAYNPSVLLKIILYRNPSSFRQCPSSKKRKISCLFFDVFSQQPHFFSYEPKKN